MNIQPSVIIWTVICFLLLMLILDRLLFRPVTGVLEERKRRLSEARLKTAEAKRVKEEQRAEAERLRLEQSREKRALIQSTLEEIQANEKILLKDAHNECLMRIDVYREQREKELEEILSAVSPKMEKVAELFAERIASSKD